MRLKKIQAFELSNMNNPDPYNEKIVFRTYSKAQQVRAFVGGTIRQTFIHEKES